MERIEVRSSKNSEKISVQLSTISFQDENGIFIVYCPSLDVSGYGKSAKEAEASFKLILKETLHYVAENGTLNKFLESQGWFVESPKSKNFVSPPFQSRITANEKLSEILSSTPRYEVNNNVTLAAP